MPAISWPMTAGWPMRCISSPKQPPGDEQRNDLSQEDYFGGSARCLVGGQPHGRYEAEREDGQQRRHLCGETRE